MRKTLAVAFVLLVLLAGDALAEPPSDAPYQGILRDASGQPLPGPVNIDVRIWDAPVAGAVVYHESHAGAPLSAGVFNLLIGGGSVVTGTFGPGTFTDPDRYLELEVNGEVLSPRQPIGASPYAFTAQGSRRGGDQWYLTLNSDIEHIRNQGEVPVPTANRGFTYDKRYDDSILKITYTDNIRAYNYSSVSSSASCFYYVYVDGETCTAPGEVRGSVYTPNSSSTNPHRTRTLIGLCSETASGPLLSGPHEVRVYVAEGVAGVDIGCYFGWNSTMTLMVEEVH